MPYLSDQMCYFSDSFMEGAYTGRSNFHYALNLMVKSENVSHFRLKMYVIQWRGSPREYSGCAIYMQYKHHTKPVGRGVRRVRRVRMHPPRLHRGPP